MTRTDMESRRLLAAQAIRDGFPQSLIARRFSVSRTTAWRWSHAVLSGRPLQMRKATGRRPLLDAREIGELRGLVKWRHWRSREFRDLILERYDVLYHVDHVSRLLVKLGQPKRPYRRVVPPEAA